MEDWEFELEFLTYDEWEKKISQAKDRAEEYSVDADVFESQITEFMKKREEWEEVKDVKRR